MQETGNNTFSCIKELSCGPRPDSAAMCHTLSIQLGLDGFSFCVYAPETASFTAYRSYAFSAQMPYNALWNRTYTNYIASVCAEICASDDALRKTYARCRVYVDLPLLTRVPCALFNPDMLPVYFQPSPPTLLRHMSFFSEGVPGRSDVAVWGLPCSWTTMWQPLAATAVDWHHATTSLFRTASESCPTVLMLYVSASSVAVMLQKDGEMVHCNTYQADSPTDVLYYAVGALRRHDVQASRCLALCISSSSVMPAEEVAEVLKPYIPQVTCPGAVLPDQSPFQEVRHAPILMQPCE